MKTSLLFGLLMAISIGFVAGCGDNLATSAKSAPWQTKIAGKYPGIIGEGGGEADGTTWFTVVGDKVTGTYEVGMYSGVLKDFKVVGDRKFQCTWVDIDDREGVITATFSEDLSSFSGTWEADDGDGIWQGKKAK
jgi:hypothetical protein